MAININYNANPFLQGMMSFYGGMAPARRDAYQAGIQNRALQTQTKNAQFSQLARFLMQQALMEQQAAERRTLDQQRTARSLETEDRRLANRKAFSQWQDQQQLEMLGKTENARLDNELIMLERAGLPPEQLEEAKRDLVLRKLDLGKRYPRFTPRVVDVEGLPPGFEDSVFAQMAPEGPPVQLQRPQQEPQDVPLEQVFEDINRGLERQVTGPGGTTIHATPEYKDGRTNWRVNVVKAKDADAPEQQKLEQKTKVWKAFDQWVGTKEKSGAYDEFYIKDSDKNTDYGSNSGLIVTDPVIRSELKRGMLSTENARRLGSVASEFDEEGKPAKTRAYVYSDFDRRPKMPPSDELWRQFYAETGYPQDAPGQSDQAAMPASQQEAPASPAEAEAEPEWVTRADWNDKGFRKYLARYGVNNPRDPRHQYNYWAAYKADVKPTLWSDLTKEDRDEDVRQGRVGEGRIGPNTYMWPDRTSRGEILKLPGHKFPTKPISVDDAETELSALLDKYDGLPLNRWPPEDAQRGQFLYDYLNQQP
jgi:hypothetical protein